MSISRIDNSPFGDPSRATVGRATNIAGYLLTLEDRLGIERLLHDKGTRHARNPPILNGLLRHKLRSSRGAPEPTPADLVVAGSHVTYMISGGGARSATLSMQPVPFPGQVLVASLLGATLIGMRILQRAPLLREDGMIDTIVVLDVKPRQGDDVA